LKYSRKATLSTNEDSLAKSLRFQQTKSHLKIPLRTVSNQISDVPMPLPPDNNDGTNNFTNETPNKTNTSISNSTQTPNNSAINIPINGNPQNNTSNNSTNQTNNTNSNFTNIVPYSSNSSNCSITPFTAENPVEKLEVYNNNYDCPEGMIFNTYSGQCVSSSCNITNYVPINYTFINTNKDALSGFISPEIVEKLGKRSNNKRNLKK
jgi:hypothetical protein